MTGRRTLVAAGLVLAVAAPSAHAGTPWKLDGKRKTYATYQGRLTMPAAHPDTGEILNDNALTPTIDDCGVMSCDITTLQLTVPRGLTSGNLGVTVTVDRNLVAYVALYEVKTDGTPIGCATFVGDKTGFVNDVVNAQGCALVDSPTAATADDSTYDLGFNIPRISAGQYVLVVYDRGGLGNFTMSVTYHANPKDRPVPKAVKG
jgi:hypothetical protein